MMTIRAVLRFTDGLPVSPTATAEHKAATHTVRSCVRTMTTVKSTALQAYAPRPVAFQKCRQAIAQSRSMRA
ncbi:hypothetical protein DEJ24_04975 [Curtobacterium sp. MCPF17_001]|nr:hypothetical protein DEJ24_04975 [Curtobacterium sp. MCPF17_001]